ncbi:MAG: AAA family ATPase [Desulfobacterales bacterium]|nr:AAA family ATPase [Desulfobacterales bacterium]
MGKNQIITIVGPKGGVGKTTISANLAIALSKLGKNVIAVDLDLGASNLHTLFGLKASKFTLDDFILGKVKSLSDIIENSNINGLGLICGGDVPGIANLHYNRKVKLMQHLSKLEYDFVLLDLSAGVSFNVVDFMIIATDGILITTPEVPSLLNAYSFIKTFIFRRLGIYFTKTKQDKILELLEMAKDFTSNPHLKTMNGILEQVKAVNSDSVNAINKILAVFKPIIVINRVRSDNDLKVGEVLKNLMNQYLNINTSIILPVHEDNSVSLSIAKLKPVMIEYPLSVFSKDITKIALKLCS